jgi:hypothetical protein
LPNSYLLLSESTLVNCSRHLANEVELLLGVGGEDVDGDDDGDAEDRRVLDLLLQVGEALLHLVAVNVIKHFNSF